MTFLTSTLLLPVEQALNAALDTDPASRHRLAALGTGQVLQVHCRERSGQPGGTDLFVRTGEDRLYLQGSHDGPVDACLSGSLPALWRLLTATDPRQALYDPDLVLTGSTGLAEGIQHLFRELDPDWEDHLAPVLGNVASHQLVNGLRTTGRSVRDSGSRLEAMVLDYLHEEADWLVGRGALEAFRDDVDALRLRIDRLQARVRELDKGTDRNNTATN